jgi:ABC-type amino acid transport substrate-binding protein
MSKIFRQAVLIIFFFIFLSRPVYASIPTVLYHSETGYPPFKYVDGDYLTGFDIEFTKLVFNEEDYNLNFTTDTWPRIYDKLVRGEIDTCGMLAVIESRKDEILYSKVVFKSYISLYSRKSEKKITLDDLKSCRVGVGEKQYAEAVLANDLGVKNYSTYKTVEEAVAALEKGQIDFLFENQDVVNYYLIKNGLKGMIEPRITNIYPT